MAVARLKLSKSNMRKLAVQARTLSRPGLVRELTRATERPGASAELTSDELRLLLTLNVSPDISAALNIAHAQLLLAEESDRLRKDRARAAIRRAQERRNAQSNG